MNAIRNSGIAGSEFIRRQLLRIKGGLSLHLDLAYARAKRKFVYGANIGDLMRNEFVGIRLGHEIRVNTDLEYILLPIKYRWPNNELRGVLETSYLHRARGRVNDVEVPGNSSSELYAAPALQFAFNSRLVIDTSYRQPVLLNTGS